MNKEISKKDLKLQADHVYKTYRGMIPIAVGKLAEINPPFLLKNRSPLDRMVLELDNQMHLNGELLLVKAMAYIEEYLREYRIKPVTIDPYKLTYWFGYALIESLNGLSKDIGRTMMVLCLETLLVKECRQTLNTDMSNKLYQSLLQGNQSIKFGKYGIYMMYKNCSMLMRQCIEANKNCPVKE